MRGGEGGGTAELSKEKNGGVKYESSRNTGLIY